MSADDHSRLLLLLRQDLKQWETSFAAANGGRKASREEIKKDGAIAKKYKEYNRLRSSTTMITSPRKKAAKVPSSPSRKPRPRASLSTPQKRHTHTSTPQKRKHIHHDSGIELMASEDLAEEEVQEENASNASPVVKRLFVDPTPQKNGRVLGLFDSLSPVKELKPAAKDSENTGGYFDSPSKTRGALGDVSGNAINQPSLILTPRKRLHHDDLTAADKAASVDGHMQSPSRRHTRTPQSSSKRYLLDTFITPSKRRRLSNSLDGTPSRGAVTALADGTPAFLRRDSQRFPAAFDDIAEEDEDDDGEGDGFDMARLSGGAPGSPSRPKVRNVPGLVRSNTAPSLRRPGLGGVGVSVGGGRAGMLKRSGSVRTLSSMIAEMRKTEDDRLDEEMDMLREMEGGGDGDDEEVVVRWSKKNAPVTQKEQQKAAQKKAKKAAEKQLLVEDSQIPRFEDDIANEALGPDGAYVAIDDEAGNDDGSKRRDGGERRQWKKKGAKRQTRKVIMRPRGRVGKVGEGDEEEEQDVPPDVEADLEGEVVAVEETQFVDDDDDAFEDDGLDSLDDAVNIRLDTALSHEDAVDEELDEAEKDARAQAAMLANLASDDDDDEEMVLDFEMDGGDCGEEEEENCIDEDEEECEDDEHEHEYGDEDEDDEPVKRTTSRSKKPPSVAKASQPQQQQDSTITTSKSTAISDTTVVGGSKVATIARAVKKVAATANANFRRMNIRGAKGAAGAKVKANARRFGRGGGRR